MRPLHRGTVRYSVFPCFIFCVRRVPMVYCGNFNAADDCGRLITAYNQI